MPFETKLRKGYNLKDILTAMTVWDYNLDKHPMVFDCEGNEIPYEEGSIRKAMDKGGIFVIEKAMHDPVKATFVMKGEPPKDVICSDSKIIDRSWMQKLKLASKLVKPSRFKRFIHGLFKSAYKEVDEYYLKKKECIEFIKSNEEEVKAIAQSDETPTISLVSRSDARKYAEVSGINEKFAAKENTAEKTKKDPGFENCFTADETANFTKMDEAGVKSYAAEMNATIGEMLEERDAAFPGAKLFPLLKGKQIGTDPVKSDSLKRHLRDATRAEALLFKKVAQADVAVGGVKMLLAEAYIGAFLENLIVLAETSQDARDQLEFLSNGDNFERFRKNVVSNVPNELPVKEVVMELRDISHKAKSQTLCAASLNETMEVTAREKAEAALKQEAKEVKARAERKDEVKAVPEGPEKAK